MRYIDNSYEEPVAVFTLMQPDVYVLYMQQVC